MDMYERIARQQDLREWAEENGTLPMRSRGIAELEVEGYLVDLVTGAADTAPVADEAAFFAALEMVCGGEIRIVWSVRPEEYFAQSSPPPPRQRKKKGVG